MNDIDKESLSNALKSIDQKIHRLNNQKIKAFFESLGLELRDDGAKD
ncbi:hypothetical protein ACFFLS_12450 [Flavobacterium procerum]|uniref:Uncharacterized protein n=1 Tax=Flavobacterium procerum TaxID=1455569 RepID=A0ABV6BT84_9FLAO